MVFESAGQGLCNLSRNGEVLSAFRKLVPAYFKRLM